MPNNQSQVKLDRLRKQLEIVWNYLSNDVGVEHQTVETFYAAFLEAAYALDLQLKKSFGKDCVEACKNAIPYDDRTLLQSLLGKRGSDTHATGLSIEVELELRPAEMTKGFSVVGPLLPVSEAEITAAQQVGIEPGRQAIVKTPRFYIRYRYGKSEIREACQRCVKTFEKLLSAVSRQD